MYIRKYVYMSLLYDTKICTKLQKASEDSSPKNDISAIIIQLINLTGTRVKLDSDATLNH